MVEADFDIKTMVLGILDSIDMSLARAAKLDLDDFLK
jgi:18S rRNA (adenine1779-N6/adenine1780-N6)-dimethyltransferase